MRSIVTGFIAAIMVVSLGFGGTVSAQDDADFCNEGDVDCVVDSLEFNNGLTQNGQGADVGLLIFSAGGIVVTGSILAYVRSRGNSKKLTESQREAKVLIDAKSNKDTPQPKQPKA